jgi:hypothetical protein
MVCDKNNRDCMLKMCKKCSNDNINLQKFIEKLMDDQTTSDDIYFSNWESTDRTKLINTSLSPQKFVEEQFEKMKLLVHSYYAYQQVRKKIIKSILLAFCFILFFFYFQMKH